MNFTVSGGGDPPKPLSDVALVVQDILGQENTSISGIWGKSPDPGVILYKYVSGLLELL